MRKKQSKAITELDKTLKSMSDLKNQNTIFNEKDVQKNTAIQMILYYMHSKMVRKNNGRK